MRFLVEVVRVQRADEAIQAGLVHAGNVDVAELALAQLGDAAGVVLDPAIVHQRDRWLRRLTAAISTRRRSFGVGVRLGRHLQRHRFADLAVEQLAQVGLLGHLDAVDAEDVTRPALRFRPRRSAGPRLRISAIFSPRPR